MRFVFLLLLLVIAPGPALGQEPVSPGQRVRITYDCRILTPVTGQVSTGCRRQSGTLLAWGADSLTVSVGDRSSRYRRAEVTRIELSRGRRSRWLTGAVVGSAVGGVAAFALLHGGGSTSLCDRSRNQDAVRLTECVGLATAFGALPGFGLGALVGAVIRSERWEEVPQDRLGLGWSPAYRGRMRVALKLEF